MCVYLFNIFIYMCLFYLAYILYLLIVVVVAVLVVVIVVVVLILNHYYYKCALPVVLLCLEMTLQI